MRSEERGARSGNQTLFAFACVFALLANCAAVAAPFSFDDITYWVGSGSNRAALVVDWAENSTQPPALVWGYRWNGTSHGNDMLAAIIAADPRLFGKLGGTPANPDAVYGLGYDVDNDGEFGLDDGTTFDAHGFAFTDPADLAVATDSGDYYAEGWFAGFWHYGIASVNPYNGGNWSDIAVGTASRTLADGAWDSWAFSPTYNFAAFAKNPVAAQPPFPPGDFNHDGRVDASDYDVWRANFGATWQQADANGNGIVDAADYVVWRKHSIPESSAVGTGSLRIPEPSTNSLLVMILYLFQLIRRRKSLMVANRSVISAALAFISGLPHSHRKEKFS